MVDCCNTPMTSTVRKASHAGSWYTDDQSELQCQLETWIADGRNALEEKQSICVRGIISPHAGFRYSGATAAHAFAALAAARANIERVFVLGPSHRLGKTTCLLSSADVFETPVGNLAVDREILSELSSTGAFEQARVIDEENEHSLEMQLPFIAHLFGSCKLVPIIVGQISLKDLDRYGKILAPYLDDPRNTFVISSDFCHWGDRFGFTPYDPQQGEIWKSIEVMDRQGMNIIETLVC